MNGPGESTPRCISRRRAFRARASNPSSEVKAIVESRGYSSDVMSIASDIARPLRSQSLLEPIDISGPDFADVWDVKKFPGRRALRKFPRDTIEAALRADGVPGGPEIYKVLGAPGGWDRAFRTLDRIKPHVNLWGLSIGDLAVAALLYERARPTGLGAVLSR